MRAKHLIFPVSFIAIILWTPLSALTKKSLSSSVAVEKGITYPEWERRFLSQSETDDYTEQEIHEQDQDFPDIDDQIKHTEKKVIPKRKQKRKSVVSRKKRKVKKPVAVPQPVFVDEDGTVFEEIEDDIVDEQTDIGIRIDSESEKESPDEDKKIIKTTPSAEKNKVDNDADKKDNIIDRQKERMELIRKKRKERNYKNRKIN